MKLATLLLACTVALPASAATLKPFTSLSGAVVRLSDLWDGVVADKPLGPAPAPGGRITVPALQLAAIARQFGVDWHAGSSADRAVVERASRTLTKEDVRPPLWEALTGAGARADAELELGMFTAPPLPVEGQVQFAISQMEYDQVSGRFSASLDITAEGIPTTQIRLTGRLQEMVDLPVVRRRMMPGDVIGADDLQWAHLRASSTRGEFVHLPGQAIGQALKHAVAPNAPIQIADLGRPVVVIKGTPMTLTLESPGLSLSAQGIAIEPGGVGERIRVLNPFTHMTVQADITGAGQARVIPGTSQPSTANVVAVR